MNNSIKMGKLPETWMGGVAKTITFCVTENCNLACKYCYMTGKNSKNKMDFEIARRAVDYILHNREEFNDEAVIWEFIGGEPFLEIKLIDEISEYIKKRMFILNHPWFNKYRFNFSTNGLLYHTKDVQEYVMKNYSHISVGISIDGNKIKHDLQRVKPDGSGSYDDVVKNVALWQKQFKGFLTKATFAHEDLPYLKDSIISLWNIGINNVAANVVFEDVWGDGDDIIFETQLKNLADYIIENEMWKEYSVRFFNPGIGFPLKSSDLERNFCGSGKMLAIDCKGNFYPCVRFYDFSLNNKRGRTIGDVAKGIDQNKLRPFDALSLKSQSRKECIECSVASGCAWCTGYNYDSSTKDTIYQRATAICKMHKANVRANEYFWDMFSRTTGIESPREKYKIDIKQDTIREKKYLQFIISDNITPHCCYRNWNNTINFMSDEVFSKALVYANENGYIPIFLGLADDYKSLVDKFEYLSIINSSVGNNKLNTWIIYDSSIPDSIPFSSNNILLVYRHSITSIYSQVYSLSSNNNRINITIMDMELWTQNDLDLYKEQLSKLVELIIENYKKGKNIEINVLTDILYIHVMHNCDAGENSFTVAPNGKIYICPAFYFDNPQNAIGSVEEGIDCSFILRSEDAPICSHCDAYHCKRCKFLNKTLTMEYNTPSKIQCLISHIERNMSMGLQNRIKKDKSLYKLSFINNLKEIDYLDPLDKIKSERIDKV